MPRHDESDSKNHHSNDSISQRDSSRIWILDEGNRNWKKRGVSTDDHIRRTPHGSDPRDGERLQDIRRLTTGTMTYRLQETGICFVEVSVFYLSHYLNLQEDKTRG